MKKLLLILAILLLPSAAFAQCNGIFPSGTACGNPVGAAGIPGPLPFATFALAPGGVSGNVQTNNGSGGLAGINNTQLTALCQTFSSVLSGCVPASGGGTVNFLRADGAFVPTTATAPNVSYTPPGSGGVVTAVSTELTKVTWINDYGAKCDSSTDDTAGIQAAINAAQANGGILGIGLYQCWFTGNLSITGPLTIQGSGFNSILAGSGSTTQGLIDVSTNSQVIFRNFNLSTTLSNKSGGYGIKFNGSGGSPQNNFAKIENVHFSNHAVALDFEFAAYYEVKGCIFENMSSAGGSQVIIRNGASGDAGDQKFNNNWFFGGFAATTYINWQSSGGATFDGNKFLGNGTAGVGVNVNEQGTIGTGLLSFTNNSWDGLAATALNITTANAANVLTQITIASNRFDAASASSPFIFIQETAGSTIGAVLIGDNSFVGTLAICVQASLAHTVLVNNNIFGGCTSAVTLNSVTAAIIQGNLLGGGTTAPASTSATVTVGVNK